MKRASLITVVTALALPCLAAESTGRPAQDGRVPAAANNADAPSEDGPSGITREQADGILRELRAIRQILERPQQQPARPQARPNAPPSRVTVSIPPAAALASMGMPDAPVTIVEFIDFQCSYCQRHDGTTLATLKERYVDGGKVRYVSRDLPLDMHDNARAAARAARCAGAQGKYWELRRVMFANMRQLSPPELVVHARAAGLDLPAFEACLEDPATDAGIRAEAAELPALGITGTPSFVIGRTTDAAIEGALIVGAQPLASFEMRIADLLGNPAGLPAPAE